MLWNKEQEQERILKATLLRIHDALIEKVY